MALSITPDLIFNAHRNRFPIDAAFANAEIAEADAYDVQAEVVSMLCRNGSDRVAGYKLGSARSADKTDAGRTNQFYGTILGSKILNSPAQLSLSQCLEPYVEPEIEFVCVEDLSEGADEGEIIEKTRITAGIEIPDGRIQQWFENDNLGALIADNGAAGWLIVSEASMDINPIESVTVELRSNDVKIGTGRSLNVKKELPHAIEWLTKKIMENGLWIAKGSVISSGTLVPPVPATEGIFRADFSDLGSVSVSFSS